MDPHRHADERNAIESILRHIPGFRGYLEKEYRRESDQLLRNWLADQLQAGKQPIDAFMRQLLAQGGLDLLPEGERLKAKIDRLRSAIAGAVQGYSGVFDFVRVGEEQLAQVYQLDQEMVTDVQAFVLALDDLKAKIDAPAAILAALHDRADDLDRKFAQRRELLSGINPVN